MEIRYYYGILSLLLLLRLTSSSSSTTQLCYQVLSQSDSNKDEFLNRNEYVQVIQILTLQQQQEWNSYRELPQEFRSNFIDIFLQSRGRFKGISWNIQGVNNNTTTTISDSQAQFLSWACNETLLVVQEYKFEYGPSRVPSWTPTISTKPSVAPSSSPTISEPTLVPSTIQPSPSPSPSLIESLSPSLSTTSPTSNLTNNTTITAYEACLEAVDKANLNGDDWLNRTEYDILQQQYYNNMSNDGDVLFELHTSKNQNLFQHEAAIHLPTSSDFCMTLLQWNTPKQQIDTSVVLANNQGWDASTIQQDGLLQSDIVHAVNTTASAFATFYIPSTARILEITDDASVCENGWNCTLIQLGLYFQQTTPPNILTEFETAMHNGTFERILQNENKHFVLYAAKQVSSSQQQQQDDDEDYTTFGFILAVLLGGQVLFVGVAVTTCLIREDKDIVSKQKESSSTTKEVKELL